MGSVLHGQTTDGYKQLIHVQYKTLCHLLLPKYDAALVLGPVSLQPAGKLPELQVWGGGGEWKKLASTIDCILNGDLTYL